MTVDELTAKIASEEPETRTQAWLAAGSVGAPAMGPLARLVAEGDLEVARAARRAMFQIVRTAGAPGTPQEQVDAVNEQLVALLADSRPVGLRRDVLWMISEIGCCVAAVGPVSKLLANAELREDARCCLERLPGGISLGALKAAMDLPSVAEEFKINVAQSLRARGVEVSETKYPCQKLVPTRPTKVQPVEK